MSGAGGGSACCAQALWDGGSVCAGLTLNSLHHRAAGALAALCQHVMKPNQVVWVLSFRKANGAFSLGAGG